jgi:TrpR family trp operon transcriptional repressor
MAQISLNDPALSQQGNEDWQCFLALLQQSFAENLQNSLLQS